MKQKTNTDWEVRKRKVYFFLFEETKQVFVNDTLQKNLLKVYDEHFREGYPSTKLAFLASKQAGKTPPMYLLEEIEGTSSDAFQYIISWFRYFSEHGYHCLTSQKVIQIINTADDDPYFRSIKSIPMDVICAQGKDLFPNYGVRKRRENSEEWPETGQRNLSLALTDEQYQMVRQRSREKNISMREFIVNCVKEKADIVLENSAQLENYLQEINRYYDAVSALQGNLQDMFNSFLCSKGYDPNDILQIEMVRQSVHTINQDLRDEILQLYQQLCRMKNW